VTTMVMTTQANDSRRRTQVCNPQVRETAKKARRAQQVRTLVD